jgi:DNA polymerase-4
LFLYAQGIDHRTVQAERERQQISKETTFDGDLYLNECLAYWPPLAEKVWNNLQHKQLTARGVSIKLKLKNFQIYQHSKSFKRPIQSFAELWIFYRFCFMKCITCRISIPSDRFGRLSTRSSS